METICVIGLWHLGLVNSVGFATKGYKVIGLDFDKTLIKQLRRGKSPIFEPGLKDYIVKFLKKRTLRFETDEKCISFADYVVIAYDCPINEKDEVSISPVVKAAKKIAQFVKRSTPVIITSQIPLGTSEKIESLIKSLNKEWQGGVVYTPENLRLGDAINCFLHPDMIVLGVPNNQVKERVLELYKRIDSPKITISLRSAEMVKHALNTFLATSITFGNEIALLCERLGVDAVEVGQALKMDKRVGMSPIFPGLGFSGGTLARDVGQLRKFARSVGYSSYLLEAIVKINEATFDWIITKLTDKLGRLQDKKIGILGLTYKPGTSTMRQSPAIKIIKKLLAAKAYCLAYDPKVNLQELRSYPFIKRVKNIIDLAKNCDALVLLTQWPEFKELDYAKMASIMKKPIIIDAKNFLEPKKLIKSGFEYEGFGRRL
ncbi:UDP-glucose/GDP-mannose dehydrogenase family protein [Candidatus Gottesmanbacteria bacterium]|nr:UDP-glucose/GDP-mannose dehydrogenase family protein [Candidatus Gottesmanbacteria bacterium]